MDWVYGQAIGFLGNFFALMGNMGVELFELEWVSAIILFFSRLRGRCLPSAWWSAPLNAVSNTPPAGVICSSAG